MSPKKAELLLSALVVLFLSWILWEARNWPAPSKLFPWALGFSVLLLALAQLVVAWRAASQKSRAGVSLPAQKPVKEDQSSRDHEMRGNQPSTDWTPRPALDAARWRMLTICGWIGAFFFGIWLIGFKLGSLLLTFAFLKFTANERWSISAAIAVGTALFFWIVFDIALKIPLDNGILEHYFSLN